MAVICPLDITPHDRRWIESIRADCDPQHALVEPHFTLVFPFQGVNVTTVEEHVQAVAAATAPVAFRLCGARAVEDTLSASTHVFLVPDLGEAAIRNLHGNLYRGVLASHLRTDIPYEPHVTVAAFDHRPDAEVTCRKIGQFELFGHLRMLQTMSIDESNIRVLHRFPLL